MSTEIRHLSCGGVSTLSEEVADALRKDPTVYDALVCDKHDDVFLVKEFVWQENDYRISRAD